MATDPFRPVAAVRASLGSRRAAQGCAVRTQAQQHRALPHRRAVAAANGRHARHQPPHAVHALRPLHRRPFDRTHPPGAVGPRPRARRQGGAVAGEAAMSKRRLPLDGPDWMPFDVLHPLICAQTGDRRFADRELTDAMASGRVRSMRRRVSPRADEPERELLPRSFWAGYQLNSDAGAADEQRLLVVERARCPVPPWLREGVPPGLNRTMLGLRGVPLRGYVFYAWKPDCKKIFGLAVALEDTKESVHEKLEKPGRPQTIRRQELREEIVRRCWQKGRFTAPESHTTLITELRAWHKRKFKNEPNYDDLRKFVGDAIAILKLVGR